MALEAEREGKSLFTHSRRTATPPLNSSVRRQSNISLWLRRVRHFSALHQLRLSCCFGLACVVVFRALGGSRCLARVVASRLFVLRDARGLPQRGVCRQRFVLRTQATNIAALPSIQSSGIVQVGDAASCCRLTSRSRRTASPPLNSSVRGQVENLAAASDWDIHTWRWFHRHCRDDNFAFHPDQPP